MTTPDAMKLLTIKVNETSQAEVARTLGYSGATISTVLKGTCPNPQHILERVVEVFGGLTVDCPVLGEITLHQCSDERKKPYSIANSQRVELSKKCPKCPFNAVQGAKGSKGVKP